MKTLTYGNTARATYTYDWTARTTGIRHTKSDGTLLAGYEYSYSNAGIPTGVVEGSGDRVTWSYDSAYRLTREQRSGTNAYDLTYTWDGAGNRLTKLASGTTTTYTYNAGDALTLENAAGTLTTYAYDSAGNTSTQNAAGSVTTYTWDDENRMTGLVLPSGAGTWTMAYNPSGLRREKQAAGTTTRFLWDTVGGTARGVGALLAAPSSASRLLQETDADNATVAHYTSGLGTYGPTVSQRRSGTSSYLHGSLLGTIEALTAADQSVSDTYLLDAWGRQIASSGSTTNPHRYVGALGYYAESSLSLDYVRARWLRPGTGGWMSVDPVWGSLRYAYAYAAPGVLRDPSGGLPAWLIAVGDFVTGVSSGEWAIETMIGVGAAAGVVAAGLVIFIGEIAEGGIFVHHVAKGLNESFEANCRKCAGAYQDRLNVDPDWEPQNGVWMVGSLHCGSGDGKTWATDPQTGKLRRCRFN